MLHTILGSDMFRKAMDLYFDRHDGNAVVAEDFVKVMEDTSSMNLQQFSLWYSQAGTPIVEAQGQYDEVAKTYTLKCKQIYKHTEKQKNNKPFLIPIKIGFVGQHSGNVLNFNYLGASQNEVVLQLSQAEQTFMFNELQELPIPSLLRDFSAPVKMKFTYMDEQLVWLMVHDTNDFNRWNAGQTYMLNQVLEFMKVLKSGSEPRVPKALIDAFRAILQEKKLNREFITLTLMLPSDPVIYDQLHGIDPHLIFNAKKLMRTQLCTALKADLQTVYERLSSELQFRPYSLNKEDIAFRSLKNLCLSYLAVADIELATKLAQAQLASADNITDRIAALTVLVDLKDQSKAISDFYDQWKHEDLVVNKWLALQAASNRDDTVQLVSDLMQSDAFDIKVPNKIYSLLGAFQANSDKFHSADGSGYKLYADFIIKIDSMNPSVSAFLAKGFDNWKKFEINRRKLMTEALVKIRSQPNLSSNLREIIEMIS
jgi:aminopeptidase N